VKIFLGILFSPIVSSWPNQLIICSFIHFTIFSPLVVSSSFPFPVTIFKTIYSSKYFPFKNYLLISHRIILLIKCEVTKNHYEHILHNPWGQIRYTGTYIGPVV
jgi:hypothetical protein